MAETLEQIALRIGSVCRRDNEMKTEVTLNKAVGKVLEGFTASYTCGQMVLTFTDATFLTLCVEFGYAHEYETIVQGSLNMNDFGDNLLVDLGVVTQEEINRFRADRDERHRKLKEDAERIQYEELKKKYEVE